MKVKLLKKIRKRFNIFYDKRFTLYDNILVFDSVNKKTNKYISIHEFMQFVIIKYYGLMTYNYYIKKYYKRKHKKEYYKLLKISKTNEMLKL